jgi:hypothetical protein
MATSRSKFTLALVGVLVAAAFGAAAFVLNRSGSEDVAACPAIADNPEWSVARRWNEALLDAIRRDLPAPTVHSRNLYHTSAAMWDAWAAYEPAATGVFVDESHEADDVAAARSEAISYAAFRVLEARYIDSVGASDTIPALDGLMEALCLPIDVTTTAGDDPAALGNRIAASILEAGLADGSNEAEGYAAPDYAPVNEALIVSDSGTDLLDPDRWQPLQIEQMVSQNGIPVENGVQEFIDPHWGHVTGFALPPAPSNGVPIDPGDPPYVARVGSHAEYQDAAVEVIAFSSVLDPAADVIDISPGAIGANPLGTHDGSGYEVNPETGARYVPNVVSEGDFGRVAAEFWADGPESETPPGHWNTMANTVSDGLGDDKLLIGGSGSLVDRLEWDVKLYLALNGANHDAAVAAWGTKGHYDYVRPISMIRWMGGLGQSSDPALPHYHPDGLPLVPGLVELITPETAVAGGPHEELAAHQGEIAVYAYRGGPTDPETEIGGVDWVLAVDWVTYQAPTFVTPSFAGYVSGHSTFSRASAEVLTGITGNEYFPGGLGEWVIPAGSLEFEAGPAEDVVLQWATYRDAADQAGISRLYGGIHVRADDFAGRIMGAEIGRAAWKLALSYYGDPG